jgi:hypothetical protein
MGLFSLFVLGQVIGTWKTKIVPNFSQDSLWWPRSGGFRTISPEPSRLIVLFVKHVTLEISVLDVSTLHHTYIHGL